MPRVRTIIASLLRGLRAKQSIYWQAVHSLGRGGSSVAGRPGSGAGSRSSSGSERYRWKVDPPWRKNVKFYGGVPPFPTIPLLLQPLGNRNSITRNLRHPKYITHSISISPLFFSLSLFFGFVNIRKESTNWRWRYFWHSNFCRILLPLINDTLRISYTKSAPELELTLNPNPYNPLIPSPFFFLFFSTARIDWPTYTFVVVLNVKLIINHAISDLLFPFTPFVFFPSPILFYYFLIPACSTNTVAGFFFLSLLSLYIWKEL